jgi:DNA-binding CsgD family transcriptional regulator
MKHCPVTGLPITEKNEWSITSQKEDYTKKFTLIGQDILHIGKHSNQNIVLEHLNQADLSGFIREEQLGGKSLHIMVDCSNVSGLRYSYKREFTDLIYNWNPDLKLVVAYNIDSAIRLQLEMFRSIAPHGLPFILADTYEDAITTVVNFKSGKEPEELLRDPKTALELQIREEFLSMVARMAWLKMFDQQVYLPPEHHHAYPFFKAIEVIQNDFKAMELEYEMHNELALLECRERLSQKTTALNAQIELNKKNAQQFRDDKIALLSRLSSQDLESTRVSTANAEKSSTLKTLCELIADLDIDPRMKQKISSCCLTLVETGQKEKQLKTDLTEADSAFISRLQKRHPNLNQRELRISLLIKLDYNSRDISRLMGLSVRGIESIRYRLHRKIGIDKHRSLKTYLTNLSMDNY